MPTEIKLSGPSMAERIQKRLLNSGAGAKPDITNKTGDGPTRVHHNIHNSASNCGSGKNSGGERRNDH
jgi:hypothetical protein